MADFGKSYQLQEKACADALNIVTMEQAHWGLPPDRALHALKYKIQALKTELKSHDVLSATCGGKQTPQ